MTDDVIRGKLESLRRCVGRIAKKRPDSAEILAADYDLQDIIAVNLERAVQLCVDIGSRLLVKAQRRPPDTMAEVFSHLADLGILPKDLSGRLMKAVGFRNVSVHEYTDIDWNIVYSIIHKNLDDFKAFAAAVDGSLG